MTNDESRRDWTHNNREARISIFSGRSRSVGNFRPPHMEPGPGPGGSSNRLREPRLSIGAGIRDLERRTADVPIILRANINNVLEEIMPIVERARANNNSNNTSLSSWLNHNQPAISNTPIAQPNRDAVPTTSSVDEVVIDVEPQPPSSTLTNTNLSNQIASASTIPPSASNADTVNSDDDDNNANNESENGNNDDSEAQVIVSNSILIDTIRKYTPLLLLILIKFVFDHVTGICYFIVYTMTFYYFNTLVKREVGNQTTRTFTATLLYISQIVVLIAMIVLSIIYSEDVDDMSYTLVDPQTEFKFKSLEKLLWYIIVTDYIIKLSTVAIKAVFTLLPQTVISTSKRGKWYLFIEATSQLYRGVFPLQPWLHYLLRSYTGTHMVIGVSLAAIYMVTKIQLLGSTCKLWWTSFLKILKNVTIGATPTKEQIATVGNLCSICHDEFKTPVVLECQHIFCEICVTKWLDREQTCPLCRAKIVDDPSWRDGSTTYFIQLY